MTEPSDSPRAPGRLERDALERYRSVLEEMDDGFCVIQMLFDARGLPYDYRFLETNPAFAAHTGLVDAIGKTALELVPDLDGAWFRRYGEVATTRRSARFEQGAEAMGRWFEVFATPVGPPEAMEVALIFKDITRRKRTEAELARSHERMRALFQSAPAFVCLLAGPDHVFELVNPAYQGLIGHRPVLGKPVREALPEVVGQGFIALLDRVYQRGEQYLGDEAPVRLDRDGDGILDDAFLNFVYQPRRDAAGTVEGIDVFGFDVTDLVRARQQAEALARELRDRVEAEQQLIGIVSHDLRTPVSAILLGADALSRHPDLGEVPLRTVARIRSSAARAEKMIRDLLDLTQARLGSGIPVAPRETELTAVVEGVLADLRGAHPGRELQFDHDPAVDGRWDPDRLSQVVENLVVNALKYGERDAPVRVEVRASGAHGARLTVANRGNPIPAERLEALFKPFERANPEADLASRSIGLGLFIVAQIVRAHGGEVAVRSSVSEGTTFEVTLPR